MKELFFELHDTLPRQGPGSSESTQRALAAVSLCTDAPQVLDIGCGPGMQTLELARRWPMGMITAVDTHDPYLKKLETHCRDQEIFNVHTSLDSMFNLPFPGHYFDVIWSEGAIYIMGFPEGLSAWKPLIKPGGYLAVTELNWTAPDPPEEIINYWEQEYPGISTVGSTMHHISLAGYDLVDHFVLPREDWYPAYYTPLLQRLDQWEDSDIAEDPTARSLIEMTREEITMHTLYGEWYSYVFYIMKSR